MTRKFFQELTAFDVDYLLISGQAAVLYGAATFSEDIYIWISPTDENRCCFLKFLAAVHARYYKLTPPLEMNYLSGGHAFHFLFSDEEGNDYFLDVLGVLPRVPAFDQAFGMSQRIETHLGVLSVIGIRDLVEIKKTQRSEDYSVISRLVIRYFDDPSIVADRQNVRWALENLFTLPELMEFIGRTASVVEQLGGGNTADVRALASHMVRGIEPGEKLVSAVERNMFDSIAALQRKDRLYWKKIIAELKELRASKGLMEEGSPVVGT